MNLGRSAGPLVVLGLVCGVTVAHADGAQGPAVGVAPAVQACLTESQSDAAETGTWTSRFFENLPDEQVATAVPARIAAMRTNIRALCDVNKLPLSADKKASVASFVNEELATLDGLQAVTGKAASAELKCRADAKCMAARASRHADEAAEADFATNVVTPLCTATWDQENARAVIAQEKANPSGVVDLARLHQAGEAVQMDQVQIDALKPKYVARRHHAFTGWMSEQACIDYYDSQMQARGCKRVQEAKGHRWDCGQ